MKRLLPLALLLAPLVQAADPKPDWKTLDAALEPGKLLEHCERLAAGEKRRFHWKSSAPVDFNVHYHEGPEVFYPFKRDGMRGDGGTFTAKTSQDYCWMWKARDKDARIQGQIETKDKD